MPSACCLVQQEVHALKAALTTKEEEASKQLQQQTALVDEIRTEMDGVRESLADVRQRLSNSGDRGDPC